MEMLVVLRGLHQFADRLLVGRASRGSKIPASGYTQSPWKSGTRRGYIQAPPIHTSAAVYRTYFLCQTHRTYDVTTLYCYVDSR